MYLKPYKNYEKVITEKNLEKYEKTKEKFRNILKI